MSDSYSAGFSEAEHEPDESSRQKAELSAEENACQSDRTDFTAIKIAVIFAAASIGISVVFEQRSEIFEAAVSFFHSYDAGDVLNGVEKMKSVINHSCDDQYYGDHCEHTKPCHLTALHCANGGECITKTDEPYFACRCPPEFTGTRCDQKLDRQTMSDVLAAKSVDKDSVRAGQKIVNQYVIVKEMQANFIHSATSGPLKKLAAKGSYITTMLFGTDKNNWVAGTLEDKTVTKFSTEMNEFVADLKKQWDNVISNPTAPKELEQNASVIKEFTIEIFDEKIGLVSYFILVKVDPYTEWFTMEYVAAKLTMRLEEEVTTMGTKQERCFLLFSCTKDDPKIERRVKELNGKDFNAAIMQWFEFNTLKNAMLEGYEVHPSVKRLIDEEKDDKDAK